MLHPNFVIVGVILNLIASGSYLIDTLKGKVKPNRVTFFLWTLAALIAFAAEVKQGVGIQSLMTFSVGFFPLLIFIASFFNRKSFWKLHRFDFIFGGLSLIGLLLWYVTKIGNVAILFAILADGLASIPTLVKSYYYPETENVWPYVAAVLMAVITLLTIDTWNFAHYAFPIYIFLMGSALSFLIYFKPGERAKAPIAIKQK